MPGRLEQARVRRRARNGSGPSAGPAPDPSRPVGTDLLPQIKHIVVLMMENHSYDNYLGMLAGRGEGFPLGPDGNPQVANPDSAGEPVRAHHLTATVQRPKIPSQSWHATHHQWNEGKLDGFVTSTQVVVPETGEIDPAACQGAAAAVGMGYWTEDDLPFYYGLARTFPVADRWFGSCLGPTFPNRRFLIAGTAHGLIDDAPSDLLDYPPAGTIFDVLDRHGISWVNYHPVGRGDSPFRRYLQHRRKTARRRILSGLRSLPKAPSGVEKDMQFTADIFPVGLRRFARHIRSNDQFFTDAANGTLPAFSIVDPDFRAYSEENPQDIQKGESFAAAVINAVLQGKGWADTLLLWVYDEHGGYYDHVPPPEAVPPDDVEGHSLIGSPGLAQTVLKALLPKLIRSIHSQDQGPQRYDRYGFRVPAVVVSPYARPDYVCHEVFDHTSVLKLVEQKWNLPPLTRRDEAAVAPLDALDLSAPPAFLEPPKLPEPALPWGSW
jgi:phospholipase C